MVNMINLSDFVFCDFLYFWAEVSHKISQGLQFDCFSWKILNVVATECDSPLSHATCQFWSSQDRLYPVISYDNNFLTAVTKVRMSFYKDKYLVSRQDDADRNVANRNVADC